MPKFYRRRRYHSSRDKYSVEQRAGQIEVNAAGDGAVPVVAPSTIEGMRKVKHLTVSLAYSGSAANAGDTVWWALVYVPAGTALNTIAIDSGGSMYEPNQFVMGCGVVDFSAGPNRIHCPLSRNLNSGDYIALVLHTGSSQTPTYNYVVRYAITLQ